MFNLIIKSLKWDNLKWDNLKWDNLKWDNLKWDSLVNLKLSLKLFTFNKVNHNQGCNNGIKLFIQMDLQVLNFFVICRITTSI